MAATLQFKLRPALGRQSAGRQERLCSDGGRLTVEQRISTAWEGLTATGVAECPICRGALERTASGGRCNSCGSSLS